MMDLGASSPRAERLKVALADRYRIERELGQGGMATVYLAHDVKHDRHVALKVLRPELSAILGAERFLAEIKTTANLQHPHILPLHDSGEADGMVFYVMPYVEGESLRDRLERVKQLPVDDAVRIAREVAEALQYAHEQGVIHRDIKPENILLHGGHAQVADFGIALAVSRSDGGTRITETGMSLGTPHYMSPEQAMGEKEITPAADVYALGCVLYEMLTGEPPFSGATAQAVVAKLLTSEPEPITTLRKTVPPNVEAATHAALQKLPADRFARAADFAAALSGAATTVPWPGAGARPAAPRTSRIAPLLPWMVAGLATVVAVAAWFLRSPEPDLRPLLVELEPPPGTEFSEFHFAALSPDGRRLAFVGLASTGGRQLWIRDLETGRVDSLLAARGAEEPFWSPTGRSLGYSAQGALWRLELDGSAPRQLCDRADPGGSWSSEDLILFTRAGHPMVVSADGGSCDAVPGAWSDSALTVSRPTWFPDGLHFAGLVGGAVVRSDTNGEAPEAFIESFVDDVQFVEPDLVVFARSGRTGSDVIAQRFDPKLLSLVGQPITLAEEIRSAGLNPSYTVVRAALAYLPTARVDVGPLIVDARGAILDSVVLQGTWTLQHARNRSAVALGGIGLWVYDLSRRTSIPVKPNGYLTNPVWSPGDSMLAAMSIWTPADSVTPGAMLTCKLVLVQLASGADTTLIDEAAQRNCFFPTDWSSDGRFLVLTKLVKNLRGELWTYGIETGALERLSSVDGSASAGALSPDQQWLAYVSDVTGELQVYVRPFRRSGPAVRVSTAGGALPRWRRDGRALFYQAPDGSIMRVPVGVGSTLELGDPEALFRAPRWSPRLFADQAGGVQKTTPYEVSPDGQRFYLRQRIEETSAAILLLNWQSLLDRSH